MEHPTKPETQLRKKSTSRITVMRSDGTADVVDSRRFLNDYGRQESNYIPAQ